MSKLKFFIVVFPFFLCRCGGFKAESSDSESARNATTDYYQCEARESGEKNYGSYPDVCLAKTFGSDAAVYADYPELIFSDKVTAGPERERTVTEMYSLIRDAARYYLQKRKPTATTDEITQWTLFIHLTAAHESRFSHYRKTKDSSLKMLRGDFGHGHGLMQIDDRWHYDAISNGVAWRLITNMTYGMDILFTGWEKAITQSCYINSSDKWKARIRSAWAAYNGGGNSYCRWTDPASKYAANDLSFLAMYDDRTWTAYLLSATADASVDAACLIENTENCAAPGAAVTLTPLSLYKKADSSVCTVISNQFQCVEDERDAICLRALGNVNLSSITPISASVASSLPSQIKDRHTLCQAYDPTLLPVAESLKTAGSINLRATPSGGVLETIQKNRVFEILDFEIRNAPVNDRYYKVKTANSIGYIYGGTATDSMSWVTASAPPSMGDIAPVGSRLQVTAANGINLRVSPGGALLTTVPTGTELTVQAIAVQGRDNEIYYAVDYLGQSGYIYGGALLPTSTTASWAVRVP